MHSDKKLAAFKLAFVLILPLFFSGCINPGEQESRGVKLSDAMKASATGNRHDLGGRDTDEHYLDDHDSAEPSVFMGGVFSGNLDTVSYDNTEYHWQMLGDVSYSQPINSDFADITHFTLTPIAMEGEHNMLGLYIGGANVQLKQGTLPERAVNRTWMLESGLTYRRYLNSSRNALSPYLATSVGFTMLSWSYRNPVTAGGDTFQSDSLFGAEGSLAIGVSTRRDYRLGGFTEVGIGGTIFGNTTVNGFDNNVFHNFGFVSVKAGISLKF